MIRADFPSRVFNWCVEVFGPIIAMNTRIRNFRFLEEALELVQSLGCTKDEAIKLVEYVYGRPVGVPHQELGGTVVTLYALANANHLNVSAAGWDEFNRCCQPEVMEKIRAKQKNKPNPEDVLPAQALRHTDDEAVDKFAAAMRDKMKAARVDNGRNGWEDCPIETLQEQLIRHIFKGDPRDVANFCMMLWNRGAPVRFEDQWHYDNTGRWPGFGPLGVPARPAGMSFEEYHLGKPFVSRQGIERATLTPVQAEGVKGGHCPKCDTLYITELPITLEGPEPAEAPAFHMNSTGDVAVADDYYTRTDFENCPRNTKVYLIGQGGVGTLAHYDGDPFWVEWAPLPKRRGSK